MNISGASTLAFPIVSTSDRGCGVIDLGGELATGAWDARLWGSSFDLDSDVLGCDSAEFVVPRAHVASGNSNDTTRAQAARKRGRFRQELNWLWLSLIIGTGRIYDT